MKHPIICLFFIVFFFVAAFTNGKPKVLIREVKVETPFDMPAIKIPDFSKCKSFSIVEFGAAQGDKEKTTQAIARAFEKASEMGGGVVVVPQGEWQTGKIHFKSCVNLHLERGAVLLFSENPEDYLPAVHTTWEGLECYNYSPLVYAYKCQNVAITGQGELRAGMDVWRTWFKRPQPHMDGLKQLYNWAYGNVPVQERRMENGDANFRPQFIQFNRCENVLLEGVTITNSPFWVIHPYLCNNVTIRKVNVFAHGHNNDGVDPEMSQNMLIEDCVFDQGDDAIAVKSGRNWDAWALQTPSKNIVVRNCTVKNGHQLLAIGSELSGGIENILMENCAVIDGAKLNHLVFIKTNERQGGYVNNIFVRNVRSGKIDKGILGIETDVLYQWRTLVPTYERRLTPIKNVFLENIRATDVEFVSRILGQQELPVENIVLKNVLADTLRAEKHAHENVSGFVEL
ncbi:MAG: glycoside hydrolase family 28 protein [Breznakibacter sp.]